MENLIYTNVRTAIKGSFPLASVSSTYIDVPSSFPHISVEETDSYVPARTLSTSDREYAAVLTYTVNIYTNTATAKTNAKQIAAVVNDAFSDMGFTRTMKTELPNIDRTIYRLTMRFQAVAWKAYDGVDGHYNITAI